MSYEKGIRVGALMSSNNEEVKLFGYGIYEGDEVPPDGWLHDAGIPNPKIKLDDGRVVWGCECWWGPEETIKEKVGERKVIQV